MRESIGQIYSAILAYINTEVSETIIGQENSDWLSKSRADEGTIAIRTNQSIDNLIMDGIERSYLEADFSIESRNPTSGTPEIGKLIASKKNTRYSITVSRRGIPAPYIIKISRTV